MRWFYCQSVASHWNFVNYHSFRIQKLSLILFAYAHSGDQLYSIYIQISFSSANESRLKVRDFFYLLSLFSSFLYDCVRFLYSNVCAYTNIHGSVLLSVSSLNFSFKWSVLSAYFFMLYLNAFLPFCWLFMLDFHHWFMCDINESISLTTTKTTTTTTTTTPRMLSCHEICCQVKWTTHPYPSSVMIDEVRKNVRTKDTGYGNVLYASYTIACFKMWWTTLLWNILTYECHRAKFIECST